MKARFVTTLEMETIIALKVEAAKKGIPVNKLIEKLVLSMKGVK